MLSQDYCFFGRVTECLQSIIHLSTSKSHQLHLFYYLIALLDMKKPAVSVLSPFQLQTTALVREWTLRTTWAITAAPTLPAEAVREPTLLFVTKRGLRDTHPMRESLR